ncbi:MAG: hypothetical protein AB8I08_27665 [Sandaracinaceae bacterium]
MQRLFTLVSAVLLAAGVAGCAPTPVDVEMSYPSRDTFLFSDFGRLLVYEVELDAPAENCPALLEDISAGEFGAPIYDSDWTAVCDFRAGGVGLDSVPPGPHAYVGITRDESNNLLLAGCRIAEAYEGAPAVEVRLFPTPTYHDAVEGRSLSCTNEEDKCLTGC